MKPIFIVALAGIALLGGGVLVASEFGNDLGTQANARSSPSVLASPIHSPSVLASPIQSGEQKNAALKTVTLKLRNMYCATCPIIIKRTLERVDGVSKAQVSFRLKTATVSYDPARCTEAKLTAATTEMGFPSTVIR